MCLILTIKHFYFSDKKSENTTYPTRIKGIASNPAPNSKTNPLKKLNVAGYRPLNIRVPKRVHRFSIEATKAKSFPKKVN